MFEGADSAQDASSHVSTVAQAVLYEFDVLQVVLNDADQMTETILLLFQVLKRFRDEKTVSGSLEAKIQMIQISGDVFKILRTTQI